MKRELKRFALPNFDVPLLLKPLYRFARYDIMFLRNKLIRLINIAIVKT